VARGAGGGESASDVIRIRRAVEILDVAGGAVGRCAGEFVSDVAGDAIQSRVRPSERIPSELEVVEFRPRPVVHQMAGFTRRWKIHRQVTRIVGLLKLLKVAGRTRRGQSLKLPYCRALMARLALHRSVRTHQREAVLVLADGLRRDLPAADRMASRAVGAHLSVVKVRVTIGAVLPYIGEDGLDVALCAGDCYVQAAEGIARRVVTKFGDRPDRAPACVRVAILTRNGKRAVRTPCGLLLRNCRRSKNHTQNEQQNPGPPHRQSQFAAPNFLEFLQPGRRVANANG